MIFTKNKDGVWAIRAMKYKKICGWKIYSRTRTFGEEVHKSNIRVKRWHNKYENSELYWKTQLFLKRFAYQVQSYWNTDLWSRGTNFWDTLYILPAQGANQNTGFASSFVAVWSQRLGNCILTRIFWNIYIYIYICSIHFTVKSGMGFLFSSSASFQPSCVCCSSLYDLLFCSSWKSEENGSWP